MLASKEPTRELWTPWETEALDWKWWLVVAVAAAAALFLILIPSWLVGVVVMETSFDTPFWEFVIGGTFLALAAFVTGLIGGLRSWWRLVPIVALYALQGVYILLPDIQSWILFVTWATILASTWSGRVLSR